MRDYFMETARLGFSYWREGDLPLALALWGEAEVTRYICASGVFTPQDVAARLETERRNRACFGVQYYPVFDLASGELAGCCGLRPVPGQEHAYELGFHLRREYWGRGYATEAGSAVVAWAFGALGAQRLYAGHHPQNEGSERVLKKLGFRYLGAEYYEPTGLRHPTYELDKA